MTVDPARAAGSFAYEGTTHYFCSKACLAKFSADPARFLVGAGEPATHHAPIIQIRGLQKELLVSPKPPAPSPACGSETLLAQIVRMVAEAQRTRAPIQRLADRVPIAAGVLYPIAGLLVSPIWASAAMTMSSLSVIANALRLRHVSLL